MASPKTPQTSTSPGRQAGQITYVRDPLESDVPELQIDAAMRAADAMLKKSGKRLEVPLDAEEMSLVLKNLGRGGSRVRAAVIAYAQKLAQRNPLQPTVAGPVGG